MDQAFGRSAKNVNPSLLGMRSLYSSGRNFFQPLLFHNAVSKWEMRCKLISNVQKLRREKTDFLYLIIFLSSWCFFFFSKNTFNQMCCLMMRTRSWQCELWNTSRPMIHFYFSDFVLCFPQCYSNRFCGLSKTWKLLFLLMINHQMFSQAIGTLTEKNAKHPVAGMWSGDAVTLYCKSAYFYPSALKITTEKSVLGIAAGCAVFVVQHYVAPSLSIFQFLCLWEHKITFEASACYCFDTCGFEH